MRSWVSGRLCRARVHKKVVRKELLEVLTVRGKPSGRMGPHVWMLLHCAE